MARAPRAWLSGGAAAVLAALRLLGGAAALRLSQELGEAQAAAGQPAPPRPLAWLHVPKSGTSFANLLFTHRGICPTLPESAYLKLGSQWSDFVKHHSLGEHCPGGFSFPYTGEHFGVGWDFQRIGGNHVVAVFRQPEQRLISGYLDKKKDYPFKDQEGVTPLIYAKRVQGCAARMLTRGLLPCGDPLGVELSESEMDLAEQRVQDLGFVGLTEEWDLSVCLFYRMFGGNCTDVAFQNTRPGKLRRMASGEYDPAAGRYNASEYLGDFKDTFDNRVYAKAQEVFWSRVTAYEVSRSTCARTCAAATQMMPFSIRQDGARVAAQQVEDGAAAFEYDWPGRRAYLED